MPISIKHAIWDRLSCTEGSQLHIYGYWHRVLCSIFPLCYIAVVSPVFTVLSPVFKRNTARVKVYLSMYGSIYFSLRCCWAHPLPPPPLCGLSDLPVNSCGCSELCLCYWKHPSKSAISYDVQMIGCAVFGYPFSFTGHRWRELPVMMMSFSLQCSQEEKPKKKRAREREKKQPSMELRQKL